MEHIYRKPWTDEEIEAELRIFIQALQRMPSRGEIGASGKNNLAVVIGRRGGYRAWAKRLGVSLKGTETHRGLAVEDSMEEWLTSRGYSIQRMRNCAPYDLLLNGILKIDVKSATYGEYGKPLKDGTPYVKGFIFSTGKLIPTCDMYILCGVDGKNTVLWRYYIPSSEAKVKMITITKKGKYNKYREDVEQIEKFIYAYYDK